MKLIYVTDALTAANELLSAKRTIEGKEVPVLGYKKLALAHSLGKVVDALSPEAKRIQETRRKLMEELGEKTTAFSSAEKLEFLEYTGQLNDEQKKEHEGRNLYQTTTVEFEKLDKEQVKVITQDLFTFTEETGKAFNESMDELGNQNVDCLVKIPMGAFDGLCFDGLVINEKSILQSEDSIITIVLMLHDIVEG